ncbi:GIY-YIG nuclease family protein [Thalassotalea psychrophila]|uniref:GIY-YIG nuclease family protein n=1 Tax=Thalassotalea psychrophila TaxID=3065647 RepID=A0ABY9TW36_9GAMM|nr:GIY-YIG nuclease family protein [Colwelliaceae bacterium SQ149]
MANPWFVYLLRCNDDSLYAGITTDVQRRLSEHNEGGPKSAKYTRNRRPVKLVHKEVCKDRSSATKREMAIKKLTRKQKLELISD